MLENGDQVAEDLVTNGGSAPELIVHSLAVRAMGDNSVEVRCTVRVGTVAPGMAVRYRDREGLEHAAKIMAVRSHARHPVLVLEGEVAALEPGRFLFGAGQGHPAPESP